MPAPPPVGSSPSTPGTPATPPASVRPTTADQTGPVFLDEDDAEPPPSAGPAAAPAWNADTSRPAGFGAPPADPRGGNWRDSPETPDNGPDGADRTDRADAARGAREPAPLPTPVVEPAPDAADGPLSERTFRVRRPEPADAAPSLSSAPSSSSSSSSAPSPSSSESGSGSGPGESEPAAPAQGGREFTVGLRRSEILRGGNPPALPAQSAGPTPPHDGPGQTQADQAAPVPASGPVPAQVRPALPQSGQARPPHQPQAPAQSQPPGLVPGQARAQSQPAHPQPAQSQPVHPVPARSQPATATPEQAQQGPPPSWAQAQQPAGGLPAQPQSGGPDAVTPWRPPANDPFARMAHQQARPAGLGKRFGARLIDLVLTLAVGGGVAFPFVGKVTDHLDAKVNAVEQAGETKQVWLLDGTTGAYLGVVLGALVVFGLLYEVLPTARWGRTLGKKLFGISVVHIEGHGKPGFGAALVRWLVYGVLGLAVIGVLNVLWCVFDRPWRQCWHDKAARTFVAKGGSTEIRL